MKGTVDFTLRTEKGNEMKGVGMTVTQVIEMLACHCSLYEKYLTIDKINSLIFKEENQE